MGGTTYCLAVRPPSRAVRWSAREYRGLPARPRSTRIRADLGRDQECVNDTTKSREFGFDHFRETRGAFLDLFDRLRAEKIIP